MLKEFHVRPLYLDLFCVILISPESGLPFYHLKPQPLYSGYYCLCNNGKGFFWQGASFYPFLGAYWLWNYPASSLSFSYSMRPNLLSGNFTCCGICQFDMCPDVCYSHIPVFEADDEQDYSDYNHCINTNKLLLFPHRDETPFWGGFFTYPEPCPVSDAIDAEK